MTTQNHTRNYTSLTDATVAPSRAFADALRAAELVSALEEAHAPRAAPGRREAPAPVPPIREARS